MRNSRLNRAAAWFLVSACLTAYAPASQGEWEIPFKCKDGLIWAEGSIGSLTGLSFLIDTGASISVIDQKLVKRLGLKAVPQKCRFETFGQVVDSRLFRLPGVRIGNILSTLHFLEADLSGWGADGLIGLDLLRQRTWVADCATHRVVKDKTLTIDFRSNRIIFGQALKLEHSARIEDDSRQVIVRARVQGRSLRLAIDSGSTFSILFTGGRGDWVGRLPVIAYWNTVFVHGTRRSGEVRLPDLTIGSDRWRDATALVSDNRISATDGVLSIAQLGIKVLSFNFDRSILSWAR